jgi:hypothetical protein
MNLGDRVVSLDEINRINRELFGDKCDSFVIAFAARCVRRVWPIWHLDVTPCWLDGHETIKYVIESAEKFVRNKQDPDLELMQSMGKLANQANHLGTKGASLIVGSALANLAACVCIANDITKPKESARQSMEMSAGGAMNCASAGAQDLFNGADAAVAYEEMQMTGQRDAAHAVSGEELLERPLWPLSEPSWFKIANERYLDRFRKESRNLN